MNVRHLTSVHRCKTGEYKLDPKGGETMLLISSLNRLEIMKKTPAETKPSRGNCHRLSHTICQAVVLRKLDLHSDTRPAYQINSSRLIYL